MSVENAKLSLEKVSQDKGLQEKLSQLPQDDEAAAVAQGLKIAEDAGFSFAIEQYKEAISATGELSDEELEGVSGGWSWHTGENPVADKNGNPNPNFHL